ncbi:MAG: TolC family protein [Deferribacterales bacterium]
MKRVIAGIVGLLCATAHGMTLQEMATEVVKSNPAAQEQVKSYNSLYQEYRKAKGGYLPRLDIYGGIGHEWVNNSNTNWEDWDTDFYSGKVVLRQDLFKGFGVQNEVKKQLSKIRSTQYLYYNEVNTLCFESSQQYLNALKTMTIMDISNQNIKKQEEYQKLIKERVDSGVDNGYDLERANAKLATLQTDNLVKLNDYKEAVIRTQKLLGRFLDGLEMTKPELDDVFLPYSLQESIETLNKNNPMLISSIYDIEYYKNSHKESKKDYWPEIYAELSHDLSNDMGGTDGLERETKASINLHYNLFNGTKDYREVQKNISLVHKAVETRNRVSRDLNNDLQLTWSAHRLLAQQLTLLQKNRNALLKVLKAYKSEFNIGKRKVVDIMDLENEIYNIDVKIASTNYELLLFKYKLLYTVGKLPDVMGVKPAITEREGDKLTVIKDVLPVSDDKDADKVNDAKDFCQNSEGDTELSGCDAKSTAGFLSDRFEEPKAVIKSNIVTNVDQLKQNKMTKNTLTTVAVKFFNSKENEFTPEAIELMREIVTQLKDAANDNTINFYVYSKDSDVKNEDYVLSSKRAYNLFRVMLKNNIVMSSLTAYGKNYPANTADMPENYIQIAVTDHNDVQEDVYEVFSTSALSFKGAKAERSDDLGRLDEVALDTMRHFAAMARTQTANLKVDVINFSYDKRNTAANKSISDARAGAAAKELEKMGMDNVIVTSFGIDHELNEDDITADKNSPKNRTYLIMHK